MIIDMPKDMMIKTKFQEKFLTTESNDTDFDNQIDYCENQRLFSYFIFKISEQISDYENEKLFLK